jgi:hypothetical protein
LQDFDDKKITSGMSGYLRQELRELETLDEITKLRFEGKIPSSVAGIYRRRLLRSYYAWKTDHRDPVHFHPSIRWKPEMGPRVPEAVTYSDWKPSIIASNKRKNAVVDVDAIATVPVQRPAKKIKITQKENNKNTVPGSEAIRSTSVQPFGFIWDSINYSCSYDSLFTILVNVWTSDRNRWHNVFPAVSTPLGKFSDELALALDGHQMLEHSRDTMRAYLHGRSNFAANDFPYGHRSTSIDRLANGLFPENKGHGTGKQSCLKCGMEDPETYEVFHNFMSAGLGRNEVHPNGVPLSIWMDRNFRKGQTGCRICTGAARRNYMRMEYTLHSVPELMIILLDHNNLTFDRTLTFRVQGQEVRLQLRGIIYGGFGHFTSRVVQSDGTVWFHDGMTTRRQCIREFRYEDADKLALHTCRERRAIAVVYARP